MAYITVAELQVALSAQSLLSLFDDNNDGDLDSSSIDAVIARASRLADGWIAPVYKGPFPITQTPIPGLIAELTIQYAIAIATDKHPEYLRNEGGPGSVTRWERADKLGERLQAAVLRMPDNVAQPKPANVGGIIVDSGQRIFIDSADGTSNRGDF